MEQLPYFSQSSSLICLLKSFQSRGTQTLAQIFVAHRMPDPAVTGSEIPSAGIGGEVARLQYLVMAVLADAVR